MMNITGLNSYETVLVEENDFEQIAIKLHNQNAEDIAKRKSIWQQRINDGMTIFEAYLAEYNPDSYGAVGSAYERTIKTIFSGGRYVPRVARQGRVDAYVTFKRPGKHRGKVLVEIKTACGEIHDINSSAFVIYCPTVDPEMDILDQGYVFSREQWKAFLGGYPGRGKLVREKNGGMSIQSFYSETRPKASKPLASYIWSTCFGQPSAREWIDELRNCD